ncbi:MAG: TVP38/TMEM64 family protein [Synechococcales cyanobacterium T60_A2020_003]|nr:TVP38/TMEM64 family protein [Synechococcales cyanobacterium T60_A2020_003]
MALPFAKLSARPISGLRRLSTPMQFLGLICFAFFSTTAPALAQDVEPSVNPVILLQQALEWIDRLGTTGAIAFMVIYALATVAFFPGSILTLGAGILFGVVWGSVYVFIGACGGATLAFLVGRYVARSWIAKKIAGNPKFAAIDKAVGREGFKIVLLTRLSPVFPFNLLNYALGLTSVSLKDYGMGFIGMIPGTIMYVYAGSLLGDLATLGSGNSSIPPAIRWTLNIIGFIATVAVTLYVTKVAQRALETEVGVSDLENDNDAEGQAHV